MPTPAEIEHAILVLQAARAGGVVDVLNEQELLAAAARFDVSPEELMDCVFNVGNSVAVLTEFLRIR